MLILAAIASVILVAGLLSIPVDLRLRAAADPATRAQAQLRVEWLFGRVGWDLDRSPAPADAGRGWKVSDWERLSPLLGEAFRDRVAQLLRRCWRWIEVQDVHGRARIGLGDPADTGIALGVVQPLAALLDSLPRVDVRIDPDFEAVMLWARLRGGIRMVPVGLVGPFVAFALSSEAIRTFREIRSRTT